MKNLKLFLAVIIFSFIVLACEKDKNEEQNDVTITAESVSAKWDVSNAAAYESFEFNQSGSYIVVESSSAKSTSAGDYHYGNYTITGDATMDLEGFGTITVTSLSETGIEFSLKPDSDPDNEMTITAAKSDEMPSSINTSLLCRTWELISIDDIPASEQGLEIIVLFSEAGTYLVTHLNDPDAGGLAQWQWKDPSEEILCYSWEGAPTCDGTNEVGVVVSSSELIITEYGYEYYLLPVDNTKSTRNIISGFHHEIKLPIQNFFGK